MKFSLEFEMDNEAFADFPQGEAKWILGQVIEKLGSGFRAGLVHDSNGNKVGKWLIDKERHDE